MPISPLPNLEQRPAPHSRVVRYTGDTLRVTLRLPSPLQGKGWLRTNLGNAAIHRQEVIDFYENGTARLGRDWHDLPMRQTSPTTYEILLPLTEIGVFEFKAYFAEDGGAATHWPHGENARVKVLTALAAADNTIYNAFVRQFGPNIAGNAPVLESESAELDRQNYTVVPPSGTFRDFARHLDFIIGKLGFRIIQFLPVHPTPTTFARMGRYGSPFAPLDFFDVDASMAQFDRVTTPLEQFREVIDQIHSRSALVFLDLPIDHTGWASEFQSHHPEWFTRNPDGSFQSPGAWGVVWADLCKLNFTQKALWKRLAEVFLHWCRHGVDGFRCDAGYMIPPPVWEYIIARVRREFPATIFFLEGLGGGQEATTRLLEDAGMDWAYSELFQNYSATEISRYLDFATRYSGSAGPLVNFAETHDNDRLAKRGRTWAALRVALNALFAPGGCFGVANGVEWLATERIDVHGASSLNWGAKENLVELLGKLTSLLKTHPAFRADASCRVPVGSAGTAAGLLRVPRHHSEWTLLAVANPEIATPATYEWNFQEFDPGTTAIDLLTGRQFPLTLDQCQYHIHLRPAEVLCLALPAAPQLPRRRISAVQWQHLKATVLRCRNRQKGLQDLQGTDLEADTAALHRNPTAFLRQLYGTQNYLPIVEWKPDHDPQRLVCLPPEHHILINHNAPFTAQLVAEDGHCIEQFHALPRFDGRHFVLFQPHPKVTTPTNAEIRLNIFGKDGALQRLAGHLLVLPKAHHAKVGLAITRENLTDLHCALATNNLGGYALVSAAWGSVRSQYEALLAANQNPAHPIDRTILFPRCRAWLIYRDFSQELGPHCQQTFELLAKNQFRWTFAVPSGMGGNLHLEIRFQFDDSQNACTLSFTRLAPPADQEEILALDANEPITLLLRPDIDDRSHHSATIASTGPEHDFPKRITPHDDSFDFALASGNTLKMRLAQGHFLHQPEWNYSQSRPLETQRGLRDQADLFSPGIFKTTLKRGETTRLTAWLATPEQNQQPDVTPTTSAAAQTLPLETALRQAVDAFVVQRKPLKTVIAGYPWFLDWGRDTLICLRGLIAAGRRDDAFDIIRQFASFEDKGTLPNMISGDDLANRDTSDAPLLLFPAVQDYLDAEAPARKDEILATDCGGRTLIEILQSIVENYCSGTPNGLRMDTESALVFSPPHFTWMDTNYPAATPREGYPIEIQALWHYALQFLARHGCGEKYATLANQARASVEKLFAAGPAVGFSDCLHARPGQSALQAKADDACRPNQLHAITLGLITSPLHQQKILEACSQLVLPGAMRSLASQRVNYELPVMRDGQLLNDPAAPYWGHYEGDEDTRRKPAYHNGTGWCFQFPLFCEALVTTYGASARDAAAALLGSTATLMQRGCLGQLPEICDGDYPHTPRGCCAQAWSITETLRILLKLKKF